MKKIIRLVRILLGLVLLINGTNWFFKIITPYPSISDFIDFLPPKDIVGAMIEHGILFHMAKGLEVVAGIALLANRMVPLALVLSMPVAVTVFVVDVFRPEFRLRAFLMGSGTLLMNITLLLSYFHHYRGVLAFRAQPVVDPSTRHEADGGAVADSVGTIGRMVHPLLLTLSAALGVVLVGWLLMLIAQYVADPKAIHEVRAMVPRSAQP
jgi:hypothetical protein